MKRVSVSLILLLSLANVYAGDTTGKYHALNEELDISEAELPQLKLTALQGSGDAAYRIAQYNYFVVLDGDEGLRWLTIAAENGDAAAEYGLALRLSERNTAGDRVRSCFWLNKAKAHATAEIDFLVKKLLGRLGKECLK